MKITAAICMLMDHIGLMFFPQQIAWRMIGRLAMPIFAFGIGRGAYYTSSMKNYMKKMFIFAVISQLPFWWVEQLAFGGEFLSLSFNIGFTFLWALMIIACTQHSQKEKRSLRLIELLTIFGLLLSSDLLGFDYGSYGIMVVLMCYFVRVKWQDQDKTWLIVLGYTVITYLGFINHLSGFLLQEIGVIGLILTGSLQNISEKKMSRFFYIFYPVHLILLCVIKWGMIKL